MATCRHTFPDGNTFDLSGLHRPRGQRDWYADDRNGNMYYFNICGDANDVPEACVMLNKAVRSPVFQVTNQSDCFWLGQVKSMEWELIDDSEPAAGVELYYFDGEQCSGGIARDVRIQLFCDPDAGVGKPLDYYVLEEDCHYSVTWPSKYGCPAASGGLFGSGSGSWLTWLVFLFGAYVALGCTYNVMYQGAQFGPEAMPNADMWRELPGLIGDGLSYTKARFEEVSNRNKTSYERVDGLYRARSSQADIAGHRKFTRVLTDTGGCIARMGRTWEPKRETARGQEEEVGLRIPTSLQGEGLLGEHHPAHKV
eukprot:CAMPEP_0181325076 /NCGR_PEP_ID=MMETSP1101-20121128/20718_1 /TAXON_ID=46948 /ORGANISM="Rhodomonas abbreviata, Strain Caron Lab Isolate" /LENGTH=310 /DNA_ID=CAMNT_0023433331 /DNA_START=155 /DNA_END=1088 /DNA_ORIENTATION=-